MHPEPFRSAPRSLPPALLAILLAPLLAILAGVPACASQQVGPPAATAANTATNSLQHIRIEIRTAEGRHWFNVSVAETEAQQQQGLMFVRSLPEDTGMLFPQRVPRIMSMWMKNTLIPLDMLFIDGAGAIVCLREKAVPESLDIINCDKPVMDVLEIAGGEAARRHIRVGDTVVRTAPTAADSKRR